VSAPRAIATDSAPKAIGPYSQAILCDGWLWCSGQIAIDPATGHLVNEGLDENAAAHIAFGLGFGDCRAPGAPPVNRSVVHLDVMIGSPEMDVEATDATGKRVTIISDGAFSDGL